MKMTDDFAFFWGKSDALSNWHSSPFDYKGGTFANVEQFMMFCKARLFNDTESAKAIYQTRDPHRCKELGRQVTGFDDATWTQKREAIVSVGLREKFLQNPELLKDLLKTGNRQLVEASPYDKIWGIGLNANHPHAQDPAHWRGENLLGKTMTNVRDYLVNGCIQQTLPTQAQATVENALDELGFDFRADRAATVGREQEATASAPAPG